MTDFDEAFACKIINGTDSEVTKLMKSQLRFPEVELSSVGAQSIKQSWIRVMKHLSSAAHDLRLRSNTGNGLHWELPCKARLTRVLMPSRYSYMRKLWN